MQRNISRRFFSSGARHFLLKYKFPIGKSLESNLLDAHKKYLQETLKQKLVIFEGKVETKSYFLFHCQDEKTPFDFMTADPLNKAIEDFSIEELEISRRDERTDLVKHLKQAKDLSV